MKLGRRRKKDGECPVVVVSGKPGAGKTTWCKRNMQPGDVIYDMDALGAAIGNFAEHPRPLDIVDLLLHWREMLLIRAQNGMLERRVYVIVANKDDADTIASGNALLFERVHIN